MKKTKLLLVAMLAFLIVGLNAQQVDEWEFTSDLEGWGLSGVPYYDGFTPTWDAGHMKITLDSDPNTHAIAINPLVSWLVDTLNYAQISMKNSTDDALSTIWFAGAADFSDAAFVLFDVSTQDTEFKTYFVDMSANPGWIPEKDNYYLGFEPASDTATTGVIEIDYIKFVEVTNAVTGSPFAIPNDMSGIGTTWQMATDMSINDVAVAAVTWSVDDPGVATIDTDGLLTSVANGTVVVTATDDATGLTGSKTINVGDQKNAWEFETDGDLEGWTDMSNCTVEAVGGKAVVTMTGGDPKFQNWLPKGWLPGNLEYLHLRMKNETSSEIAMLIGWIFDGDPALADIHYAISANDADYVELYVDLTTSPAWQPDEEMFVLRMDPSDDLSSGTISYDFIRFIEESPIVPTSYTVASEGDVNSIIGIGNSLQMLLSYAPELANRDAIWTVDDVAIATIDDNGLLTAVTEGAVTVTATSTLDGSVSGTAVINVHAAQKNAWEFDTDGDLEGWTNLSNCTVEVVGGKAVVTITAADPWFQNALPTPWTPGDLEYLHLKMKNETAYETGMFISWLVPDGLGHTVYPITANNTDYVDVFVDLTTIATWTPDQNMAGLRLDPANDDAAASGTISYDFIRLLEESPIVPTTYTVAGEEGITGIFGLGNTLQMILSYEPELANRNAIWSVDDVAIATIDDEGLLTAVSLGDVTVTATSTLDGSVSGTAVITVGEALSVTGVEVTSDNSNISAIGGVLQMGTVITPFEAGDKTVTWSVDDTGIATIDATGILTAVAEGTVVVTATSVDQTSISGSKTIIVSTAQINAWEFTNDVDGWGVAGSGGTEVMQIDASHANGSLVLDVIGDDPYLYSQIFTSAWTVGDIKYMHLSVKNESNDPSGELFMWKGFPTPSEIQTLRIPLDTLQSEFKDIYIDMYDLDSWSADEGFNVGWTPEDTYSYFRLDPIKGLATAGIDRVSVDFIRFITTAPALESLDVSSEGGKETIGTGTTLQMLSTPWPNISDSTVTWSVSDDAIASIDATTGLLTAVIGGTVSVTATSTENTAITSTMDITVIANVAVSAIDVTSDASELFDVKGTTMQMTATISPADATNKDFTWSVNDENIATIDQSGLLTSVNDGTVTVTATAEDASGVTGTKDIIVTLKIYVMRITVKCDSDTLKGLGNTMQMSTTIIPGNASSLDVTWSVSDDAIASIDAAGLLTAVAGGTVTVTATATDGTGITGIKDIIIVNNTSARDMIPNNMKLYPNPANNVLHIDYASHIETIAILDITGQVLKQVKNNSGSKLELSIESLDSGLYLIKARTFEGDVKVLRFVKN